MKKIILSFLIAAMPMIGLFAQMTKGYVKIEITEATSDNEQMAMGLEMMKGSETEYFFDAENYVTKMNMMGGMVSMENHINVKTKKMDMLMDAMGNKMWIDSNMDEAKAQGQGQLTNADVDIKYDKADTKVIQGMKAYKFSMKVPNPQMPMDIEGYITEEISSEGNLIQGMENVKFAGFPLEFTLKNQMMTLKMEATEVKKDVDASVFDLKTDGYKKMTLKEFQAAMGGMGGGMGF